jgi:N-carbamoyl-L-amino-acid hydrolase
MRLTLEQLNNASDTAASSMLKGIYEHSDWIAEISITQRPFKTLAGLKYAMMQAVSKASKDSKLSLLKAHPELAGKAMVNNALTSESKNEQTKSGLTHCSEEEFQRIQTLNTTYNHKFGWPFILAVRGPRGTGLSRAQIIETFERRVSGSHEFEFEECLRQVHRIAELRLNDKFDFIPALGNEVWDWHEALSTHSDPGFKENKQLTVTYLTQAHQNCAKDIKQLMLGCGFDSVHIDAVGNVVGRYLAKSHDSQSKFLMTGSHYDTVRNGGKFDGRLGIFVPIMCVRELSRSGTRLREGIEVVAFAEEEGQRYSATFLGSGALVGAFDPNWLSQNDVDGISMLDAMKQAGLDISEIANLRRDPSQYSGFIEVHIEQGPVLNELGLPLGVVTSINGSVRYMVEIKGVAAHAGTTPMDRRQDALCAASELALYMEQRAKEDTHSVATIGQMNIPSGSINVIPGLCKFSMDMRAPSDIQKDKLAGDILRKLEEICSRRRLTYTLNETLRINAAPSAPDWQNYWEKAVNSVGLPIHKMPSGAGHDAMKIHEIMPQAMLFVRGENSGISHNPLESTTSDDIQLGVEAFMDLLMSACNS